ncbi:MAG: tyrosine-type recombinase/integrase [Kiritimatiellia bacterium]
MMKDEFKTGNLQEIGNDVTDWKSLIAEFLDYQKGLDRAESTLESHTINLGYWTGYLEERGVTALSSVTPQITADYQAWLYQRRTRFGRSFTVTTQIGILNSLKVFFKYLLKSGKILTNPAESVRLPKEPRKLPGTILTPKEMKKLLSQPDTSTVLGFRDRTMYKVLYSTGLRVGELTGMRVQDLNFNQGSILIPKSKHYKQRYVPLGETACRYLAEYLDRIRPLLLRSSASSATSAVETVLLSRCGGRLDMSGVGLKLHIYARRAGIKKHVTVHTFRHTLATEMLRHGADLRQIQELLGHRQLRSTQVYTHIFKGELKRIQSHCHPREQTDLPDGFTTYRGRDYLTEEEIAKEKRHSK